MGKWRNFYRNDRSRKGVVGGDRQIRLTRGNLSRDLNWV